MNVQSRAGKFFLSPFVLWIGAIAVASYFMFSFDKKMLSQPQEEPGVLGMVKHHYNALKLTYIKKGIDLAGGVYLVLTVELEKALENKLGLESRSLDTLFKSKNLAVFPTKKEVKDMAIQMTFPDDSAARVCYNLMQDSHLLSLKIKQSDTMVVATLTPEIEQSIRVGAVEQGVNVLNNRLGGYGVEGISVIPHGERQIVIQLPGMENPEHIKSVITKTAHLEFKIVEKEAATKESLLDEFDGELPSDKMIIPGQRDGDPDAVGRWYLVSAFPDLTGDHVTSARVEHDQYNKPEVAIKFDSVGGREFAELTGHNIGRRLGIIIDNVMFSAPNILNEIPGGSGVITNIASIKEAFDLSVVLKSGSLHAPLRIEQEQRVGASLGQDSISKGILSCLIALLLLFIFSLLYYKIPGFLAILTLVCNIFLTLMFLSYFGATLTLPGIAGIVLTIGMAIDVSILIYERVKEELALGTPFRKAVLDGFSGTLPVILDSNITTFLTGVVLFQFGGPAIKGFAVTLMAGIVATILSGVYFLKAMYKFFFDVVDVKQMKI
jgi:preprotein translocase subunit SecD